MGESANVRLVRKALEAWNATDWEALEAVNHPETAIRTPDGWPEGGEFRGWPTVRAQLERLKEPWDRERYDLESVEELGDCVLTGGRWRGYGLKSGLRLDLEVWILSVCRDGRIARTEYHLDAPDARRALARNALV